jgi:hypothetical protein
VSGSDWGITVAVPVTLGVFPREQANGVEPLALTDDG